MDDSSRFEQEEPDVPEGYDWCAHVGALLPDGECAECEAYVRYLEDENDRMCPEFLKLHEGYDDPITIAYGASDVITDVIIQHVRKCQHAWCIEQREDFGGR